MNAPISWQKAPPLPQDPLPDVLGWKYSGNRHHPTEKPVTSLQPLIESFTHPNAIVLDPFAGSGSTCVAALQAGRRYIGIELMEQYHKAGSPACQPSSAPCSARPPTTSFIRRPRNELCRTRKAARRGGGLANNMCDLRATLNNMEAPLPL
jgi:hypothetical protein